jgi:LysM repeat protein
MDEINEELKKPVDEIDEDKVDEAKENLPRNVIKVEEDQEEIMDNGGLNTKPFEYTVNKGDTLKSIAERFGITYPELATYLVRKEGTASIYAGQTIKIPRHFIDLTSAA